MKEFTTSKDILEELNKIGDKYLECIYIKTNAFDIYLSDAFHVKVTCDKGVDNISFNTKVNMQKFPVEAVEKMVYDTEEFELFEDFYDEDDDCEFYAMYFKDSEVKIYFCINLDE